MSRTCLNCNVKSPNDEFAQCCICKVITHICTPLLKNANVDAQYIAKATTAGFRYVCKKCTPSLTSFSATACNIQIQLTTMNQAILDIAKEVKVIKEKQAENNLPTSSVPQNGKYPSFSDVVKETTLILTPRDSATNKEDLKQKVRESIIPEDNIITGLHTTSSNKVILKSGNSNSSAFESSIKGKLQTDFEIKVHRNDIRRLKLIRFHNHNYSHDEITNAIVSQNVFITDPSSVKVIKENNYRDNNEQSILIIQLDAVSHKFALDQGYLSIKWNKYKVFDALTVNRCYKCSKLGHISHKCSADDYTCPKCADTHKAEDCKSETYKCINCIDAIAKFSLDICSNHPSYSNKCPTMLHRLSSLKKSIDRSI